MRTRRVTAAEPFAEPEFPLDHEGRELTGIESDAHCHECLWVRPAGMPAEPPRAIDLLERALLLEPRHGVAHAFAAMCHYNLFLCSAPGEALRACGLPE